MPNNKTRKGQDAPTPSPVKKNIEKLSPNEEELAFRIAKVLKQTVIDEVIKCIDDKFSREISSLSENPSTTAALQELSRSFQSMRTEIKRDFQEMSKEFRKDIQELKDSQAFISGKFEELSNRTKKLEILCKDNANQVQDMKQSFAKLQSCFSSTSKQVNELDRLQRLNFLEFHGIPEVDNENTKHLIVELCRMISIDISEDDIETSFRKFKSSNGRIPPIIAKFKFRNTRDAIISARTNLRTAVGSSAIKDTSRIFIVENLTEINRKLFHRARELKREKGYAYLWTKYGKIYIKKNTASSILRVDDENDLLKIR